MGRRPQTLLRKAKTRVGSGSDEETVRMPPIVDPKAHDLPGTVDPAAGHFLRTPNFESVDLPLRQWNDRTVPQINIPHDCKTNLRRESLLLGNEG